MTTSRDQPPITHTDTLGSLVRSFNAIAPLIVLLMLFFGNILVWFDKFQRHESNFRDLWDFNIYGPGFLLGRYYTDRLH